MSNRNEILKRKLGYLSKAKPPEHPEPPQPPAQEAPPRSLPAGPPGLPIHLLPGHWQKLDSYTYVRREKAVLPGVEFLNRPRSVLQLPGKQFKLEDLLFFDVETTGLSGGAGSFIFLLGAGWFTREKKGYVLEVEQVFLDDFPGESEYITYLSRKLTADRLFVSYNGKSFDSHLLKSRFSLNGQELELPHQLDLLHLVRSFCKNTLAACSLACVERELLHIFRDEDVPGALVPEVYLSYLQHRRVDTLSLVFAHNYQDILSLAQLFILLEKVLAGEELAVPLDWSRVGEYLLRHGRPAAIPLLEKMFKQGEQYAGEVLSLHYKRLARWEEALPIWFAMSVKPSLFAKLELAKYFEHHARDFNQALFWINALEKDYRKFGYKLVAPAESRTMLMERKARIVRKLERQKQ